MSLENYLGLNITTTINEPEPKRLESKPRRPESPQGKDFPNLSLCQIRIVSYQIRHDSEATAADHQRTENENISNIDIKN